MADLGDLWDKAQDIAEDVAEDVKDEAIEYGLTQLDPLIKELLELRDEVREVREAVTEFKEEMEQKFEVAEIILGHLERVYQFFKRIPFLKKMF